MAIWDFGEYTKAELEQIDWYVSKLDALGVEQNKDMMRELTAELKRRVK